MGGGGGGDGGNMGKHLLRENGSFPYWLSLVDNKDHLMFAL